MPIGQIIAFLRQSRDEHRSQEQASEMGIQRLIDAVSRPTTTLDQAHAAVTEFRKSYNRVASHRGYLLEELSKGANEAVFTINQHQFQLRQSARGAEKAAADAADSRSAERDAGSTGKTEGSKGVEDLGEFGGW